MHLFGTIFFRVTWRFWWIVHQIWLIKNAFRLRYISRLLFMFWSTKQFNRLHLTKRRSKISFCKFVVVAVNDMTDASKPLSNFSMFDFSFQRKKIHVFCAQCVMLKWVLDCSKEFPLSEWIEFLKENIFLNIALLFDICFRYVTLGAGSTCAMLISSFLIEIHFWFMEMTNLHSQIRGGPIPLNSIAIPQESQRIPLEIRP